MAKFYGRIGYAETVETEPGVYIEQITERMYYGDVIRNIRTLQNSNQVNSNIDISNEIDIIADPYAYQNFHSMRYVEFMGALWTISKVDVKYPRLTLSIGGVYNGPQA